MPYRLTRIKLDIPPDHPGVEADSAPQLELMTCKEYGGGAMISFARVAWVRGMLSSFTPSRDYYQHIHREPITRSSAAPGITVHAPLHGSILTAR